MTMEVKNGNAQFQRMMKDLLETWSGRSVCGGHHCLQPDAGDDRWGAD